MLRPVMAPDLIVFPELALNGYLLKDMVSLTGSER